MLNSHDPLGMMMMTALGMVTVLGMVTLLGMVTVLGILTIIEYKLTGTDRRTSHVLSQADALTKKGLSLRKNLG